MSSPATTEPLTLGRITGFRGLGGEVTVRVASGHAERWLHLRRAIVRAEEHAIESARAYRDRLVLKFVGIDDANRAAALKGSDVSVPAGDLPALPEGEYWSQRLVGARVRTTDGTELGLVEDVVETGGTDLLLVRSDAGRETLIPMAREIVIHIDEAERRIDVLLPEGLLDLNGETA